MANGETLRRNIWSVIDSQPPSVTGSNKAVDEVERVLPRKLVILGLQHVLVMYAGKLLPFPHDWQPVRLSKDTVALLISPTSSAAA